MKSFNLISQPMKIFPSKQVIAIASLIMLVSPTLALITTPPLTAANVFPPSNMHGRVDVFHGSFYRQSMNVSVGQVFDVSFSLAPIIDLSNVVIQFITPGNLIHVVHGDEVSMGDVKKGETVTQTFQMVAKEEVDTYVTAKILESSSGRSFSSSCDFRVTTPNAPHIYISPNNGEPENSGPAPSSPGITIKGTLNFYGEDGNQMAVIGGKVILMDDDWGPDEEVATDWTDWNGRFSFTVSNDDGIGQDGRDPYIKIESENSYARCRPGIWEIYIWELPKAGNDVPDGFYHDYGTLVLNGADGQVAWQVLDAVRAEADWIRIQMGWARPKLNVYYPSDGPQFHWGGGLEHIDLPRNNHDRVTVWHEYGHAVMYELYGDSFPSGAADGPDPHYVYSESNGGFALVEGWAEFMQCAVGNDPDNLSAGVWQNIETNDWYNYMDSGDMDGSKVEGSIASILWDIFDPEDTADRDDMYWGFDEIFTVMRHDRPNNMEQFWDKWKARWPTMSTSVGPLCTIYWHYGIDKDIYPPSSGSISINAGATYTTSPWVTLTLSASDYGSGVAHMRFSESKDPYVWSGWFEYSTSKSYRLTGSLQGKRYIYVQFCDNKGMYWNPLVVPPSFDTIVLDTIRPTCSIVINFGDPHYTKTASVTLYLTYYDATSGVDKVRYRNTDGSWTAWMTPSATKPWTLTKGKDGQRKVMYEVRDKAGWIHACIDEIILDTTPPITHIVHPPSKSIIDFLAGDALSGVKHTKYRIDSDPWQTYTSYFTLTGTGTHTIRYYSIDNVGNIEVAKTLTVHYLTVNTDPDGIATVSGEGWYDKGESAKISVSTVARYTFKYWYLDGDSGTPYSYDLTTNVVMDDPHTAIAKFVMTGDIDEDGDVDHKDLLLLASAYGSKDGDPRYIPQADLNDDGKVDHKDLLILAANYGKEA